MGLIRIAASDKDCLVLWWKYEWYGKVGIIEGGHIHAGPQTYFIDDVRIRPDNKVADPIRIAYADLPLAAVIAKCCDVLDYSCNWN